MLARLLDAGLKYQAIDISTDLEAYNYVTRELGAKSVPVVVATRGLTTVVILGYEPTVLKELIADLTLNEEG